MRSPIKISSFLFFLINTFSIFGQHGHFDESTCLLIHDQEEIHHHSVSNSMKSNTNKSQSSTHVFSYCVYIFFKVSVRKSPLSFTSFDLNPSSFHAFICH